MTPNDTSDQFISAPPAFDDIPKDTVIQPVHPDGSEFLGMSTKEKEKALQKLTKRQFAIGGALVGAGIGARALTKYPITARQLLISFGVAPVAGAAAFYGTKAFFDKVGSLTNLGFAKHARQNMKTMLPRVNMKKIGLYMSRMNPAIGNTMMSSNTKRQHAPGTKIVGQGSNRRLFSRGNVPEFN